MPGRQDRSSAPRRSSPADAPTATIAPGVTMAEVDELTRRARRAESDGELREALRLYRAALEAASGDGPAPASAPPALFARIADLHARLDEPEAARGALGRYLDAAEREAADAGRAGEAARAHLTRDPDQGIAIRAARVLDRAGRTDEAVQLLRGTWETRTGLRLPAGEIERAARRLAPDVDLGSWTPEWPPPDDRGGRPARVAPTVRPEDGGAEAPAGDGRGDERGPEGRPPPGADGAADGAEGGRPPGEGGGRDDGAADTRTPARRFVRRYDRSPGGEDAGEGGPRRLGPRDGATPDPDGPGGDDGAGRAGPAPGGGSEEGGRPADGSAPDAGGPAAAAAAANGAGELRRGLEVLEDLLELAPRDRRLRRRKVQYARRLGDPGLLERALVELGDLLDEEGAHRGARLLYDEAGSSGRRTEPVPGAAGAGDVDDIDEAFRRRLSEALEDVPRELERLQAAGRAALGAEGAGRPVPWPAHRELGRLLLLRGRPDEAARHLAAARDRGPAGGEEAADVLYHLGVAHRRAGRPGDARDCFRRLADRDRGFAVAWEAVSA